MNTGRRRVVYRQRAAPRVRSCFHSFVVGESQHDAVGGGHTDTHDGAHQRGTLKLVGHKEHPKDSRRRRGVA